MTTDLLTSPDALRRVSRVLDGVTEEPKCVKDFRLNKRPREINPHNYQSRPPLIEVVPAAQTNPTDPSDRGDGGDGGRTMDAPEDSATSGSRSAAPDARKRKAS